MIRLFFKDNREPVELKTVTDGWITLDTTKQGEIHITDNFVVWRMDFGYCDQDITATCSHIEFENGKFVWEVGNE